MEKFKNYILILMILSMTYCDPANIDVVNNLSQTQTTNKNYEEIEVILKKTFRIDINTISVDMEYFPESFYVNCDAEVVFTMFKDNTKPVIHLEPIIEDQSFLNHIQLNGQMLDISNRSDIRIIDIEGSNQKAIEFQRNLDTGINHTLNISYKKNLSREYYMLASQVSDLYGRGNEQIFPTINRPAELAKHQLRIKVNSNMKFRMIGSGKVQEIVNKNHQEWTLDTEREIASYTLMFALLPEEDTLYKEQRIDGVDVRIMTFKDGASIENAFDILQSWLPELRNNIGAFPMPRGLSILLMNGGGGMEYYGATISSLWALKHEIFHMYYACSTVCATYRDSWIDEAVTVWYEDSGIHNLFPINNDFTSNMVSGRSPVGRGFDGRAYEEGARIMEHIADSLGSKQEMIDFLSYIHQNYSFKPFTTVDFVKYLKDYSGLDYEENIKKWVFSGENVNSTSMMSNRSIKLHEVNLIPTKRILKKFNKWKKGVKK